MPNNKITIGTGHGKEKGKEDKLIRNRSLEKEALYKKEIVVDNDRALDQNIWGSDSALNKMLDKEILAEKRMYVRARYFQHIECNTVAESLSAEPIILVEPMKFDIFDLSMGGIGIIYDQKIKNGLILSFNIRLDQIAYFISCEVVYCIEAESNFKIGLRIIRNNKEFINHLKILVARFSLTIKYSPDS